MTKPEFNASELNQLANLARKPGKTGEYYQKARKFVLDTLDVPEKHLSVGQLRWLFSIKKDLQED
jgi:hypothetical protein